MRALDHGTLLVVEERGVPLRQLAEYGAGWQTHVEDLAAHLAGRARCDIAARWGELVPHYRERLAAQLSADDSDDGRGAVSLG
ncbi:hypothetical protein [Luteimicrobium subarcticum]|uniref:hypothetical protein n=1 Tax=Luteimicrobium subarcticum TaxID=620910 RepID=UPI000C2331DC|nr:hypothetical protein [Luteimicrobium subarcticum]